MEWEHEVEEAPKTVPLRITANWRRFANGLWRIPEGDISSAYCAHIFPKLGIFTHDGRVYTNCGNCFSGVIRMTAMCFPLIPPDEYRGPSSVRYSYEGKEGVFKAKKFRLGPKILFDSSDPTIAEWPHLLRVLFADGGYFAHGVMYSEFLSDRVRIESPNQEAARAAELELCDLNQLPRSQEAMRQYLEGGKPSGFTSTRNQMELSL